jgi:hypothetical protein
LVAAEELGDGTTEYLIERALDEARAQQFRLSSGLGPPAGSLHQ